MKSKTTLIAVFAVLASICACNKVDKESLVNLALNKTAIASSNYDYNLTAQLVTDGIIEDVEPSWVKVSTAAGELPKREKEWTLDYGPHSAARLDGPENFLDYQWSGRKFSANCVRIKGMLVSKDKAKGYSIDCYAGGDSLVRVGGLQGYSLPGIAHKAVTITDPNKEGEEITVNARDMELIIPLKDAEDFDRFKIEFKQDSTIFWRINSVDFTTEKWFRKSKDTGPYASAEARGFSTLPSEDFSSVWMSADDQPQWITVDLGALSEFNLVNIHWIHKAKLALLESSEDGEKWKKLMPVPAIDSLLSVVPIKKGKGRYIRLSMTGADSTGHFAVSEIQVIGVRLPDKKALFKKGLEAAAETAGIGPGSWQLQRAGSVEGTGEEISSTGYDASAWLPAVVPGTVLTSYVEAGVVPDPGVADNIQQISESFFNSDFWYRGTVPVPTDSLRPRTILNLDGINWKAEVFMNGHRLGDMAGAFIRGRFDVTELLDTTGSAIIAIHVIKNANYGAVKEKNAESPDFNGGILGADNPTFHATVGWDWIPTVRGREVGIWNDVRFTNAKDVVLDNPMVQSRISQPDTLATMTFSVDVTNLSDGPVRGTVAGSMDSLMFSKAVALMPGETRTVAIGPSDCPELMNRQVALWWPNGYGEQALHDATFTFVAEGDTLDTANPDLCWKAGIREITWSGERTSLNLYVNGHRFLPKGGNWGFSEYLLRYGADEYDKAVSYHKEMNLNMIRNWVGQTGDEEFYDACDKYGILVWQDFWLANPTDGPDPDDEDMFIANAEDYVKLIRRHPSIGMYCGRNEGYPPATLNARLVQTVGKYHPGMLYIPSSADDGVSGHGPYRAVEPDTYFAMPAPKFHTERGMPAIMNIGSLTATLGEDHLWPSDDVWGQHDFTRTGAQGDTAFLGMVGRRFGDEALESAESFTEYAQYINYDGYRAMYEANNVARKGLLIWMSHSAWPSLAWQTYDYYFDKTAAFYGVMKACEPLHVQFNPSAMTVQAVNSTICGTDSLTVKIVLTNLKDEEVYSKTAKVCLAEDTTIDAIDVADIPDGPCLMRLTLTGEDEKVVSENLYLRNFSSGKDTGDYREIVKKVKDINEYVNL